MIIKTRLSSAEIREKINVLRGRAAGVIYGFRGAGEFNRVWYDQWGSAVISSYGHALEDLGLQPFFCDVETFGKLAFNGSLPDLVCTFNLNAGITPISHWNVVPAVSQWFDIPALPASADVLTVCERKDTASLIAAASNLKIAKTFTIEEVEALPIDFPLIVKPRDLGGSVGIQKIPALDIQSHKARISPSSVIQEFIEGFDLTVPIVWQPSTNEYRCPAGVLYIPEDQFNQNWWHDQNSKSSGKGYTKQILPIPKLVESDIQLFARNCQLGPYARIDFRMIPQQSILSVDDLEAAEFIFIEVNPLPTLRQEINFLNVVENPIFQSNFITDLNAVGAEIGSQVSPHALVLACALCSLDEQLTAKHDE